MTPIPFHRWLMTAGLAVALSGCLQTGRASRWVDIRPVSSPSTATAARDDGDYGSALQAMDRGDYAGALQLLQVARAHNASDVRVINAFGVIYDKLGRFDLSARYYAQAQALDPQSSIVANNLAYSQMMKADVDRLLSTVERQPDAAPTALAQLNPLMPSPVKTAAKTAWGLALPDGQGKGVTIIDASGMHERAEIVRQRLVHLGWSAPQRLAAPAPVVLRSTVIHPANRRTVAAVLAMTLPSRPVLIDCGSQCSAIVLTLGADSVRRAKTAQIRPDNKTGLS